MFISIRKLIAYTLIISIFFVAIPQKSHAIFGAGDTVVVVGDASPTGIENFINHTMGNLKDFVLDKLATMLAKQILHQLTVSVINWINTGFEGSPSFLQNPGAFFLDAADQVSGAFLASNGPLASLCSPFAIDIRLGLALQQTTLSTKRYTCTFSKIYEAQKNGPDIIVNGQVIKSSQSSSMNGFLKGDFNQGGWPAFISLTTEPQNNPYGAFLMAQADLNARINARQNVIHADLQLGQGFMSWQSCKDIPGGTVDPEVPGQVEDAEAMVGNDPSVKRKPNKDGTLTYQTCETQTPGSVISGQLQTSLNVPVVELELADSINAVIDALITKMTTTLISGGLSSLSSGGSGSGGRSYTQEVITEINSEQALQGSVTELSAKINASISVIPRYTDQYTKAINLVTNSKNQYLAIKACLSSKSNSADAVSEIDSVIVNYMDPLIYRLNAKYNDGMTDKKRLQDMLTKLNKSSVPDVQSVALQYTDFIKGGGTNIATKINDADTDLANAEAEVRKFDSDLTKYRFMCETRY